MRFAEVVSDTSFRATKIHRGRSPLIAVGRGTRFDRAWPLQVPCPTAQTRRKGMEAATSSTLGTIQGSSNLLHGLALRAVGASSKEETERVELREHPSVASARPSLKLRFGHEGGLDPTPVIL